MAILWSKLIGVGSGKEWPMTMMDMGATQSEGESHCCQSFDLLEHIVTKVLISIYLGSLPANPK
jgi:hypothetical protein